MAELQDLKVKKLQLGLCVREETDRNRDVCVFVVAAVGKAS